MTDTFVNNVDELKKFVGQELRVGKWHELTQAEINQFADATGDHQWIHVDGRQNKLLTEARKGIHL